MFNVEQDYSITIEDTTTAEQFVSKESTQSYSRSKYSSQGFSVPSPTYNQELQIDNMALVKDVAIFSDQLVSLKINGVSAFDIKNEAQTSTAVDRVSTNNLIEGVVGVWSADGGYYVNEAVFYGSGENDLQSSGTYSGSGVKTYIVKIDSEGTPDTYKWSDDGGLTWKETEVVIVAGAVELAEDVEIQFASTTGHSLDDYWMINITHTGTNYYTGGSFDGTVISLGSDLPNASTEVIVDYSVSSAIPFTDKIVIQGSSLKSLYLTNTSGNTANISIIVSGD
jgi:hypothetical protein